MCGLGHSDLRASSPYISCGQNWTMAPNPLKVQGCRNWSKAQRWSIIEAHVLTVFSLFKKKILSYYNALKQYFFIFVCAGSLLLTWAFSSCSDRELLSNYGMWILGPVGFSSCCSQAPECGLSSCGEQA